MKLSPNTAPQSSDKTRWGVTIEYDISVMAETQEKAEKLAKQAHGLATGCDGYVTGSWGIKE